MLREGISAIVPNIDEDFDILGFRSVFRVCASKLAMGCVNSGKWFSFCYRIKSPDYNVSESQVDLMACTNSEGIKIGSFLAEEYPSSVYRSAVYKYLLRDFLCYYESPAVAKDSSISNGFRNTFNKYLITSSIEVISCWLGIPLEDAVELYGDRLSGVYEDSESSLFPYVKLYESDDGIRKVSRPQKKLDLEKSGTRIVPLFALMSGISVLYDMCSKDTYDIYFLKDGGVERSMNITFNVEKLRNIYGDCDFFTSGVSDMFDGDFLSNPNLCRGNIKVFEVGGSRYDDPTRAISYARITAIKKADPDLSYINIDLDSVIETFFAGIRLMPNSAKEIINMLDIFDVGLSRDVLKQGIPSIPGIETWANSQYVVLGTVFLRQLALFMIGNSEWFGGYTGAPIEFSAESVVGAEEGGEDFELDFAM